MDVLSYSPSVEIDVEMVEKNGFPRQILNILTTLVCNHIILPHITPFGTATWPNSADYGGLGLRLALPSEDSWRRSTPELRSFRRLILQWQLVAIFNKRDQTIAYYCQLSMAIINYKRLLRIVIWQVSSPKWRKSVQNPQHRPFTLVDRISMDYWYIMICYDYPQCLG